MAPSRGAGRKRELDECLLLFCGQAELLLYHLEFKQTGRPFSPSSRDFSFTSAVLGFLVGAEDVCGLRFHVPLFLNNPTSNLKASPKEPKHVWTHVECVTIGGIRNQAHYPLKLLH